MQVAQLVMMIMCKPGQMAVVSSCQEWTWHLPRTSFMVILRLLWYCPQPAIDLCGRRGGRQLWSSSAHFQEDQQRQSEPELCMGLFPKAHLLWHVHPKAKICDSVYECQYCSVINAQEGKTIAADDTVFDKTVHVEHLLLQSNPNCFVSHSSTYLVLSIMKHHIY